MRQMFSGCKNLENIDISSFEAKNVIDMNSMFYLCTNIINIDLSSFDTKKVKDMKYMFSNCWSVLSLNLSSFDINFLSAFDMLYDCFHLEKVIIKKESSGIISVQSNHIFEIIKV